MSVRPSFKRLMAAVLVISVAAPALADDEERTRPGYSRLINIDALIDNHARFLARKYNLSADQDDFTQEFLRQKADAFLGQHREELFSLVDRLFEVRAGGDINQEELVEWGRRVLPLYEEAKGLIVEGNDEWRQILNDEQRAVHDEDLRLMYDSFANTEDQLERIIAGQMTVEEFRKGRRTRSYVPSDRNSAEANDVPATGTKAARPPRTASRQERPGQPAQTTSPKNARQSSRELRSDPKSSARPNTKTSSRRGSTSRAQGFESQWEAYVREFIQKYQLDDGQAQKARSILKDCQEQAQRIMQKRKPEIEHLDKKLAALTKANKKDKTQELAKLNERRSKLLEPINGIFERQLKPRLDKLPTRAQRAVGEKAGKSPRTRGSSKSTPQPARKPPTPRKKSPAGGR